MAYYISTATDYKDLLADIKARSEENLWITERWETTEQDGEGNDIHEWIARGPGLTGVPVFSGTGNGTITGYESYVGAPQETWLITCHTPVTNGGVFSVVGSVSGAQADATVGTPYDNTFIKFTITDGAVDYVLDDQFVTAVSEQIYIGIKTYQSVASDYYNFKIMVCTGYTPGNPFETQPGNLIMGVPLFNQSTPYWLLINAQRIHFSAKIGTNYESGYLGKIFPYGTPGQYPYPVVVVGMLPTATATRYSDVGDSHSFGFSGGVWNPSTQTSTTLQLRDHAGVWIKPDVWPWNANYRQGVGVEIELELRPPDGINHPLLRAVLNKASPKNVYGEFDGVLHSSAFGLVVEDVVQVGGVDHVLIQNAHRAGFNDYIALRLE